MDKALIEKAFKFWWSSRYLNSQHIRQAKNAFIAGATWQREQLEAEKNKLIKDTEVCRKATDGTDDYSVGMRNGMEVILCTLEKREPRIDKCLPRTNNLSEREQLIKELREAKEIIKKLVLKSAGVTVRYRGNVNAGIPYPLEKMKNKLSSLYDAQCDAEQFLAKLDELEGDK